MNGRVARELRKAAEFEPNAPRSYETWTFQVMGKILQFNEFGDTEIVDGAVDKIIVECVSSERKVYQYFKKKYMNFGYEAELNVLPNEKEKRDLRNEILTDLKKEEGEDEQVTD